MKLTPNYSYEFNCILNENYDEQENIKNFASLLSDKDRFLVLLSELERNKSIIEEKLGYELNENYDFYIVRAEKFKSFSEPITIEYSLLPEEMLLFLFKEIIKVSAPERFPDETLREEVINSFIDYILINGQWKNDLLKFSKNLHDHSKSKYENYQYDLEKYDYSKKTLKEILFDLYENINFGE